MSKSPDAFRTISEVADWLGIQAHVLRFWESKFTQVKPIKRAGGRRYYRPADMLLLGGIKKLLHDDGLTIKGVQKILREEGMSHVAAMSTPLDDAEVDVELRAVKPEFKPLPEPPAEAQSVVLPFEAPKEAAKETPPESEASAVAAEDAKETQETAQVPPPDEDIEPASDTRQPEKAEVPTVEVTATPDPVAPAPPAEPPRDASDDLDPPVGGADPVMEDAGAEGQVDPEPLDAKEAESEETSDEFDVFDLPAFIREPAAENPAEPDEAQEQPDTDAPAPDPETVEAEPEPQAPAASAKPRDIGMPDVTPEQDIHAEIATLTRATRIRALDESTAKEMAPLLAQLTTLRDRMAVGGGGAWPKF